MSIDKILVAVDGSLNADRVVSYMGNILGASQNAYVELIAVNRQPLKESFQKVEEWRAHVNENEETLAAYLEKARQTLVANSVSPQRIMTRIINSSESSVAQVILDIQRDGDFGTIVVGRRGASGNEEFVLGSISSRVVRFASACAVWVI